MAAGRPERNRYNVIAATELGPLIVNRNDTGVGAQLLATGIYEPDEIQLFESLLAALPRDPVILDVGANIGTHAILFAERIGPGGRVHAFEAQRIVYYMLAGNVALHSLENVFCHHRAVGSAPGRLEVPQFDYARPLSFGSVEFGAAQREPIGQQRGSDPRRVEHVDVATVDGMQFPAVHLLKIDVEGMELDVLVGAEHTVRRDHPIVFLEYLKGDRKKLATWLLGRGYRIFPHRHNWLCLPPGSPLTAHGSQEITDSSSA